MITTAVVGLAISHLVAILAGWWAKAKSVAKAEALKVKADVAKAKPEAEKLLAEAKAEAAKVLAAAKAEAAKLVADVKKL
jgi:hypothetical protein